MDSSSVILVYTGNVAEATIVGKINTTGAQLTLSADYTIVADYGLYIPGGYEIANAITMEISTGSILEIG